MTMKYSAKEVASLLTGIVTEKHGSHDQSTHGRGRSGGGKASSQVEAKPTKGRSGSGKASSSAKPDKPAKGKKPKGGAGDKVSETESRMSKIDPSKATRAGRDGADYWKNMAKYELDIAKSNLSHGDEAGAKPYLNRASRALSKAEKYMTWDGKTTI